MRVLIAPDKFKSTASAPEVAAAIADAVENLGAAAVLQPLADGGEGTLDALGGANRTAVVSGPLGDPVEASWRLGSGRAAVIEIAEASGLQLVGGAAGNDAVAANTAGTGELIDAALQRGARSIVVGVGGSATTDGGWGAVRSLHPVQRLREVDLVVACDVRTTFVDAAETFGPQKGATDAQVEFLRRRLVRLGQVYASEYRRDVTDLVGGGAAGGLAGGLAAIGAGLVDGFEVVADSVALYDQIESADLVVTGEGRVDATSLDGKVVGGVCALAADAGVPVVVIAGDRAPGLAMPCEVATLVEGVGAERSIDDTSTAIAEVAQKVLAPRIKPHA